jgi:hypothetical protein
MRLRFKLTSDWAVSWPQLPRLVPAGTVIDTRVPEWRHIHSPPPNAQALDQATYDEMRASFTPQQLQPKGF